MSTATTPHIPVMLHEVLEGLAPKDGEIYVDGTFGAGGYSRAILDTAPNCTLYGFDRDPSAYETAQKLAKENDRFIPIHSDFGALRAEMAERNITGIDGIVIDIGVSSMQIDEAERGFSFQKDGPLDMRMDTSQGETASDLIQRLSEEDLANILYLYGDEKKSRIIARAIKKELENKIITRTSELAALIEGVIYKDKKSKIHPATRSFQALRIAVNDELGQLKKLLLSALSLLRAGGRLVVVSFHSLEDRIVKQFFKLASGQSQSTSRYAPMDPSATLPSLFEPTRAKAQSPSAEEIEMNIRARSAKLRCGTRTEEKFDQLPEALHALLMKGGNDAP